MTKYVFIHFPGRRYSPSQFDAFGQMETQLNVIGMNDWNRSMAERKENLVN